MYSDEEINEIATKAIYDNKLNKMIIYIYRIDR